MKRADALLHIQYAGYHGDTQTAVRIYIEHRISFAAYLAEYRIGARKKAAGMRCGCAECLKEQTS